MIIPITFLWEQLDGPQISAIKQAIFDYAKNIFDQKLDYINNISIESANDSHLTLFGLLSGLVRPTIVEPSADFFYFTERAEHNTVHGFSSPSQGIEGGRFSAINQATTHNVSLNEEHYRALLRAWVNGEGEIGSLVLLDDICAELTRVDLGNVTPFYNFQFLLGPAVPEARAQGDIFLDMGESANWNNPMHIYAVLRGIADSSYAPVPQIFLSLGTHAALPEVRTSPEGGTYSDSVTVTLSESVAGATIYYTLDGSIPTPETGTMYTGPLVIATSTTIIAVAYLEGYAHSQPIHVQYNITT